MGAEGSLESRKADILQWIAQYDICFVEAATGMGKSTRIPQYVMDEDLSHVVWQLQPRRLAAKRLAEYIARSRGQQLGDEVGYKVRGDQQDYHQYLHVLMPDNSVQACGEFWVVPCYEYRRLKAPHLNLKPAGKISPAARAAPVSGLGPQSPTTGSEDAGYHFVVAMELEAMRLHQRQGKQFRGGKSVRSWLMSWLPSDDHLDVALVLAFWGAVST